MDVFDAHSALLVLDAPTGRMCLSVVCLCVCMCVSCVCVFLWLLASCLCGLLFMRRFLFNPLLLPPAAVTVRAFTDIHRLIPDPVSFEQLRRAGQQAAAATTAAAVATADDSMVVDRRTGRRPSVGSGQSDIDALMSGLERL